MLFDTIELGLGRLVRSCIEVSGNSTISLRTLFAGSSKTALLGYLNSVCVRDEHWTGLGMDWIRTMTNFVDFGLDPDCEMFTNLGSGPDLD